MKGASPTEVAWRGIEACREGDWNEGLYWLGMAARVKAATEMPSQFYAYLGYAIARFQDQKIQGLKLCRHALELEFYQPENYFFLARTLLMLGDRRAAIDTVERGLLIDAGNEELLGLRRELGERRPPVLPFLARGNPLNRMLGMLRHRLVGKRAAKAALAAGAGDPRAGKPGVAKRKAPLPPSVGKSVDKKNVTARR